MMSLLSVTVKKARYVGPQASQFNTYVTLKLQNVKSTTVTVKGTTPCWEQDFLFETNDLSTGLLIEVWSKGMIWDRALGYHYVPLQAVQYSNEEGTGNWLSLEAELVMKDGEVFGTKSPTGHSLLVDCRFELPFDPENIEASDLQRKLEMLNNIMDQEARLEQARRQMQYFGHSGYSEDSDYTSDLNYPVGQHANSSASQFRSAAHQIHTPQRSLETSRENSYERDDAPGQPQHLAATATHQYHLSPGSHRRHYQRYSPGCNEEIQYGRHENTDFDPLFYNSRPRNKPDYSRRRKFEWDKEESQETWASCETSFYNQSIDSIDGDYSLQSDYYQKPKSKGRRPSLERQTTLYDDSLYYDPYYSNEQTTQMNSVSMNFNQNQSYDEYYDSLSYPYQEERYGQDEEDRQWDSGGCPPVRNQTGKKLPSIPNNVQKRRYSNDFGRTTPTIRRKMPPIPTRCNSRQSDGNSRGASLPPTPTKTPKVLPKAAQTAFNSLPPTPRQLPKPNLNNHRSAKPRRSNVMKRTSSAEYENSEYEEYVRPGAISAREVYNEDYNYAYQSIDNLPAQPDEVSEVLRNDINEQKVPKLQYQSQSIDDYYYNAQDEAFYEVNSHKEDLVVKPEPQKLDDIETRDDEIKRIFNHKPPEEIVLERDQPPKIPVISTVQINQAPPRSLQPQDSMDFDFSMAHEDPYDAADLEPQESIESYVEDVEEPPEEPYKAIKPESPSSVIHVVDGDHNLRRASSQITVVDPYHPRRSSVIERRVSGEFKVDSFVVPVRKNSIEVTARRDSLQVHLAEENEVAEKKSVSFEDEEELKQPRQQVTAQQRWHWAYNKIIMQLNVSDAPDIGK